MNRRWFLREGIAGGALAIGTGGFLYLRRSHARVEVTSRMLDDAVPALASNSLRELETLPHRAREEIRRYFHGKCLNVEGFVTHLCSDEFAERLGRCNTQEDRETCFLQAFCGRVASDDEILNRVEAIAAEVGGELDLAWAAYCTQLSFRWNTRIQGYGRPLGMEDLTHRLGELIRAELAQAARQAVFGNRRPSVGETIGKIGESAVRLLPLARIRTEVGLRGLAREENPLVIPVFFLLAARHVWDYFSARLEDRRGDYQAAISGRLALLGNRVGSEFEREVRQRLTDLHTWQERSVRETAGRLAGERVGLI
jgi:hypothetical protein